jgi:type I restriction enzyme S subunit
VMVKSMELPNGWAWATLDQLAKGRSQSVDPSKYRSEKFELYSIPGFDSGSPEYLAGEEIGSTKQLVGEGDVLISKINPRINRVWLVGKGKKLRKIASTEWIVFPRNDCVDGKYLKCFLRQHAVRNFLATNVSGVGGSLMRVKPSTFDGYRIPIAPLSEQRRIVEKIETLFAELDKGEESLRQVQVLLARYRQSVLKAAVTGELTADWRAQRAGQLEHGRDLLARILKARRENWQGRGKYKEPNQPDINGLPELPENWAWATLESLAANAAHAMVDGPFGSKLKTEHYTKSGVRVIRLENIGDGVFIDKKSYISEEHAAELQRHSISGGDIVIASLGVQLPKACIVPDRIGTAIVKADCIKFSPNIDFVVPNFIMAWLNSPQLRRRVAVSIRGVGRPRLNLADLRSLAVPLPSWEEQRVIARLTEASERFVHSIDYCCVAALKQSSALRQSILNTAFSGKLVPQELSDEPASELLARVRAQRSAQPEKSKRRKTSV